MADLAASGNLNDMDMQAFEELFDAYEKSVFMAAFLILGDRRLASDVVQSTFLKISPKVGKVTLDCSFRVGLFRIMIKQCLVYKDKKLSIVKSDIGEKDVFKERIANLPMIHRIILTLIYYNRMDTMQVAEVLGYPEIFVRWKLQYCKKSLKI